jgi:hypothetical protein
MTSRSPCEGGQRFCNDITKCNVVFSYKKLDTGEGGTKNVQNCMMSFMDDPLNKSRGKWGV